MKKKSRNKKIKIVLLVLVLCITLGYAALRTGLNISGIATIPPVSWDVYFDNYQKTGNSNVDPTTEPVIGTKTTTVSYAVTLPEPGDVYEFTIDAVNDGTIDAMIESVSSKLNDVEIDSEHPVPSYLNYKVTYSDGAPIKNNYLLKHDTRDTYKVRLEFKEDVDPGDLPQNPATLYLDLTITYVQADENAKERPPYKECTYDGELVQGAEYVNGQYTYAYRQEWTAYWNSSSDNGYKWNNMDTDGWGVRLTSPDSTDPVTTELCTSINDKPIVSMQYTFAESKARSIDINSFDTSNVTDMTAMFISSEIESIDINKLDTHNVTSMVSMFSGCKKLKTLNISNWDNSNLTSAPGFISGSNVEEINITNWIAPVSMNSMFGEASSLEKISFKNVDTSNTTGMSATFNNDKSLIKVDLSEFDTSNLTNVAGMFGGCSSLKELDLSNWDIRNINTYYQSQNYTVFEITSLVGDPLEKLKMNNAIIGSKSRSLFHGLEHLTELQLNNIDTTTSTDMSYMFGRLFSLKTLDLSDLDTSNVTDMSYMFITSSGPEELDLSKFNTSKVTTMKNMFTGCTSLERVNLSSFNTSRVTNMTAMFFNTQSLTRLDLSSFDMSNVTYTGGMFADTGATIGYARTQADADILNASAYKPSGLTFTVK